MTSSSKVFILLAVLAAASAAPWPSNPPKCSTECPIAGSPKLAYSPQKTYVYSYSGKSRIQLEDVEGGQADMEWSSQVELTWLTPCDMAISLKNPSFGGGSGPTEARFLERYPLVVAMIDGRVQQACSHPEDDVWSVNMKKGIASAFQNTLPSNSSINTGLNFTETDIIGNCSTRYEVQNQGETVIVKKMKNHRYCQDLYINQAETSKAWPKAPLPMEESVSECKQEITKGIYTSITCKDKNIIRPVYGSYKYVEAHQESVLRFQSENDQVPPSVSRLQGRLIKKSLRYDQETLKKDPANVAKLDEALKQVCEQTKQFAEEDSAAQVAKALHYLRRIPEEHIPQTLQKIRSGQMCGEHQKLEGIFLDAVAFIREAGAVKVMVEELLSGKATGGRAALYTAALYFTPRPCIHSVTALKPLFENFQRFPRITVAAASMVNTYCRLNPNCQDESPVKEVVETLSNKVSQICTEPGNEETRQEALVLLKALANMGVMNSEIARPIIQCIEKEKADNSIRVAATQTFRNVQCHPQLREATKQLVDIAVNTRKGTEARIGAYLAAMKCAEYEDLRKITIRISKEENTQVRGFILSHMLNVQESSAPHKQNLKYLLESIVLPSNFTSDLRKYSQNIDLSYYAPTFGVGAGMESNIIYAPGSYVPRSVNMNLTAALGATPLNFGEIGARFEGIESVLEDLFGPEGYLMKTPTSQIFPDISSSLGDIYEKIMERMQETFRQKRSIDLSTISHLFKKLYGDRRSQKPKVDFYARMGDQEMAFGSLVGDLKNINVNELISRFFDSMGDMMNRAGNANVDSVRTSQIYLDYHYPTMQGMPLKMKIEATAVAGLKMETRLSGGSSNLIKFSPSLSTQVDGFVGFDYHIAQVGIKMNNRVSTAAGASVNIRSSSGSYEIEVDLPEKMEIINMKSETYLLKSVKGQPETKIHPSSVRSTRFQVQSCMTGLEPMLGLKVCYDVNMPNIFRSEGLPLGPPATVKMFLEKSDSSMKGYRMKANVQNTSGNKQIKVEMEAVGSSSPRKANAMLSYSGGEDMKTIKCVLESQSSGGIKVEIKNQWTQSEKMVELIAYGSRSKQYSSDSKAIEAKFQMTDNSEEVKIDSHFLTFNTIKEYVDMNFEANGDLRYSPTTRIPVPERLRKFEMTMGVGRWHIVSFVQKASESQYKSAFKFGQKGNEMMDIEGTHNIEGSSYRDMTLKTDLRAKIGSAQYKKQCIVYYNDQKIGATLLLTREGESTQLAEMEMLFMRSGETYKMTVLVNMPAYIKAMRLVGSATHQGSSQYQVNIGAKHGQSVILQLEGPVTAKLSSKLAQLQAQIRMSFMHSEPYRLSTSAMFAKGKQSLAFDLSGNQARMMALEWNMASQDEQETKIDMKLNIPSLVEENIEAIISEKTFHVSVNQHVMPKSSSPTRMKGFVDIDFESKKASTEFAWDADRSPNQKVKAEVAIVGGASTLRDMIIQGGVTYLDKTSHFKTEMSLADPRTGFNGRNSMKVQITTPSQRNYKFETIFVIEKQSSSSKVDTTITIKTPEGQEYKLNSESTIQWLGGAYNVRLATQADVRSPHGQTTMNIEAKHQLSSSQREAYVQVRLTNPSLQQPIQTKLTLTNQEGQFKTEWKIEQGSSADGAMYELRLTPEHGVQLFKVELNLKEIQELMKSLETLVSSRSSSGSGTHQAGRSSYIFKYNKPMRSHHTVSIKTPSRSMEGEVKYSDSEYLVKMHPYMDGPSSKYELYAKRSHSTWNQQSRFEGHVSHPALERDLRVDVQYERNEQRVTGSMELDIFPNTEDKIMAKLESRILSQNTIIVDAQLSGKALKVNPKVTVAAAYGPRTVGIDIMFHKKSSSPVSLLVSGKMDMSFGRNAVSSFIVKTDGQTVMDFSGSIRPHQSPSCYGMKMASKIHSSVFGTNDVDVKMCKPLFMELITKKHGSDMMYIAKFGLHGMKSAEVSIAEADPETEEKRVLGMARVMLASPSLMKAETKYEGEQLHSIKREIQENWSRLTSQAGSWLDEISREVLKEGGSSPSAKMAMLWQEIKDEASRIYDDLKYDNVIPEFEKIKQLIRSDIIRGISRAYSKVWSQYTQMQQRIASSASSAVRTLKSEFDDVTQIIIEAVMGSARCLQTGEMPEGVQRLWEQFQETSVYRAAKREIDSIMNQYPEEYQNMKQMIEKVKATFARDFDKQRNNLIQFNKPRRIINWIVKHMDLERMVFKGMDKFVRTIVQKVLLFSVRMEGNHIELQLPIRRPVYSLPQAASHMSLNPIPTIDAALWSMEDMMPTPMDNMIWAYYSYLPRHPRYLLPPYNRTAVVADGTEILTFDGAVLRAPRSQCNVLLAQYKSDSLVMQNQQSASLPHFVLKASGVTVEVKPDFTVNMNGQPVSGPEQVQGEVKVYKKSEKIEVLTPFMALRVYKQSHTATVEASGWTFGQLAGLLGTYDGEMGNDWMTPSASMASTLQDLVKSWQEDQQCQTPSVSPLNPLQVPVAQMVRCHKLLGVRSRCNPVVRPEPFMKMCYASKNACHVARAYSALCATKGVKDVFPLGC